MFYEKATLDSFELWKYNSSTLTRKLDRVIIVNIAPLTRLLKSFHTSRPRPGGFEGGGGGGGGWQENTS